MCDNCRDWCIEWENMAQDVPLSKCKMSKFEYISGNFEQKHSWKQNYSVWCLFLWILGIENVVQIVTYLFKATEKYKIIIILATEVVISFFFFFFFWCPHPLRKLLNSFCLIANEN